MKKKIVSVLLSAVMALSLAACGSSGSSNNGAKPAATGEERHYSVDEIKVNIWDNNQLDGLQKIADEWTEQSGVKVKIDVITWTEYWTLLEAGASGGELPDVF